MIRFLPFIFELAILVYALIDCIQTDSALVRNLPKPIWILLIIVLPLVGGIAWLVAGRPQRTRASSGSSWGPGGGSAGYRRPTPPKGPDDDPDFLRQMRAIDDEHEKTLRKWEDDLRRREQGLTDDAPDDDNPPKP